MKNIFRWINPIFLGIMAIGMVWFVTDIEANVYIWRLDSSAITGRVQALILVIVGCYIFHFVSEKFTIIFFRKTANTGKKDLFFEYSILFIMAVIIVSLLSLFSTYFINHHQFTWAELIRNNALIVPILLIYYTAMRNNKIADNFQKQTIQLEKLKNNQLETELKFLRAQYHPHFLFNALNTIYFQIDEKNKEAKQSVELLSDLLRYQLYNIDELVNISKEISFIKSYIAFQRLRMSKQLIINIGIDHQLNKQKIYPLIYQPLLENAFKHIGGEYWININMQLRDKMIVFEVENSIQNNFVHSDKQSGGIGIENLKRRLALLYPGKHEFKIIQNEKSYCAELSIKLEPNEY